VKETKMPEPTPDPVGRRFDPDWSPRLVLFAVVWFALVGVGAYFFWSAV
jgi:hypothetical protein